MQRVLMAGVTLVVALTASVVAARAPTPTAQTIYVDCTNTSGVEDGTAEHPYDTIQEGIVAAVDGDTVVVRPGTYYEYTNFLGKAITVTSTDPLDPAVVETTVINTGGIARGVTFASGEGESSVLSGFTITQSNIFGLSGIYCRYASPTITHNVVTLSTVWGNGGAIHCYDHSSPTITDNTIVGNLAGDDGGGICCEEYSHPTITNNTIAGNNGGFGGGIACTSFSSPTISSNSITGNMGGFYGGGLYCTYSSATICNNDIAENRSDYGGGIACFYPGSPSIVNNNITGNTATFAGGAISCYMASPPIANNIIAFNSSGVDRSQGTPTLRSNCVYNPDGPDYSGIDPGEGDISADPLFADREGGDCHLTAGSPCIDAGWNDALGRPDADMEADPRPYPGDGVVDIGADEWLPTPVRLRLQGERWHLIAIPCDPASTDPWEVFDELRPPSKSLDLLSGSLYRYDEATAGYVMYQHDVPEDFGPVTPGDGYWLWLYEEETISYDAVWSEQPYTREFPTAGWHLLGSPHPGHTHLDDTAWRDATTGPYPFSTVSAPGEPCWVQDPLYRWSPTLQAYLACGFQPEEDDCLRAFKGYWLCTFADQVTLEIPAP